MKNVLARISTVLCLLLLAPIARADAPAAMISEMSGNVQIVRGGKAFAAKTGTKLSAGDRVISRGGRATIFSLSGPPRALAKGQSLLVAGRGAGKNTPVWRAVYTGISNNSGAGARVAATVRNNEIELLSPVATSVTAAPVLRWNGVPTANSYIVTIFDSKNKSLVTQKTAQTFLALAKDFPRAVGRYNWQVEAHSSTGKLDSVPIAQSWFAIAPAADIAAWQAGDREIVSAVAQEEDRVVARAAWAAARGFRADALALLLSADLKNLGSSDALRTAAQKLNPLSRALLRRILNESGLGRRIAALDSEAAPTPASIPPLLRAASELPLDGRFAVVPPEARRLYADEAGLFSMQIPQSWGAQRQVVENIIRTDFGSQPGANSGLSVAVAPIAQEASTAPPSTRVTARLLQIARDAGVAIEITSTRATTFKAKNGNLAVQETAITWREKQGDTERIWRGALQEFAAGGKSYVLAWSAVQARSTVEFDRTPGLLQSLLSSFAPDAGNAKTSILAWETKALREEMMRTVTSLTAISERSRTRHQIGLSAVTDDVLRERLNAAAKDSLARADLATEMARASEEEAWTRWSAAKDEASRSAARELWVRADALRRESYQNQVNVLKQEMAATDARLTQLRAQTPALLSAPGHLFLIEVWLDVQALRASTLQTLAFDIRDRDAQENWAQRELEIRRTQLQLAALESENSANWRRRAEFADALESLGAVLNGRAEYATAQAYYRLALAWRQTLPEAFAWRGIEGTLRNLGSSALNSGDLIQAREHFTAALREIDRVAPLEDADYAQRNDAKLIALRHSVRAQNRSVIWNNLGYIAEGLGDYALSRENYGRALQYAAEIPDTEIGANIRKSLQARTLNNLGALEAAGGNLDAATKHHDAVLVLLRERSDTNGLALWMANRARLMELRGDTAGASRAALDGRDRFLALRNPSRAAFATVFLSRLALLDGNATSALQLGRESLQLARTSKNSHMLALATRAVAVALAASPKPDWREFDALIAESLQFSQRISSPIEQSATLDARAQGKQMRGDFAGAEADYRAAIARLEAVRATAPSAESFSDKHSGYYERLVRLLLSLKRPDEAFDVLQRARSSALREHLRLSTLKSTDPALQKLLDRAAELEAKLRTLRAQRETALAEPAPDPVAVENLTGLIASTQAEFFAVSGRLKKASPAFDRALTISPLELKKASTSFPAGTVLVQYALLEDELYIFVVSSQQLKIYQPGVRSNSVLEASRGFRALMDSAQADARAGKPLPAPETDAALKASLTQLHTMLIAPIQNELRGQKMLAFVPSGALYYVPLHALARQTPQGLRFVIEDIPVAYLAAADILSVVQAREDDRFGTGALALGDPTGADLPQARKEARAVAQIMPASQSLVGDEAQKSALFDAKNLNRRVLHLAAHGVLNAALPDDSYIQLAGSGDESRLRVGEIVGLNLNRIDLVTLSACQTALGERAPSGGEISSLAQSFSSAGATSVIASLWSVEDDSTRQLMETFYRAFAAGQGKATSLQRAQIALLQKPATRHPFFWAPFELLGDWR